MTPCVKRLSSMTRRPGEVFRVSFNWAVTPPKKSSQKRPSLISRTASLEPNFTSTAWKEGRVLHLPAKPTLASASAIIIIKAREKPMAENDISGLGRSTQSTTFETHSGIATELRSKRGVATLE
ncbi:hypothetical protein CEXT_742781 [Caerostris extrusa]|uniref:Uncharacterized protein n=1 Tax=Caerostris extrusa TaxID=172846 RepID=A0AAV4T647_CAEEX|nr:hypothetical protein CEXT_742781 [Caerostris extrusa]